MSLSISESDAEKEGHRSQIYTALEEKINDYLDSKNIYISSPSTSNMSSPMIYSTSSTPSPEKKRNSLLQKRLRLFSVQEESDKKEGKEAKYLNLQINVLPAIKLNRKNTVSTSG